MIPAQRKFANTVQYKYPDEKVIGAATHIDSSMVQEEHLALLPAPEVVLQTCPRPASSEESPSTLLFCSLRAYVDNQTLRCPAALFPSAKTLLEELMEPLGVRFHASPAVWDSVENPEEGLITLGIPMWAGPPSRDSSAGEPTLLHAVGSDDFIIQRCLTKLERDYLDALEKLREVLSAAPSGRDVRSSVERTLRICIVPKLTHFARAFPPSLIKSTLKRCDAATLRFAIDELYAWSPEKFWTKQHERLVGLNLQLPRGAGLIPQHQLCDSAYVASWLQPLATMASAFGVSEKSLLREWSVSASSPALLEMKACLSKLGFESLRSARKCFSKALQKHKERLEQRKEQGDLPRHWEFKFHWQKFLSKGV